MKDKYIINCPYCGGVEMIEALQKDDGVIYGEYRFSPHFLFHVVCRGCGSVVRSYVKEPEKLLKKNDRK